MYVYLRHFPYKKNLEFRLELKIGYQIYAEKDIEQNFKFQFEFRVLDELVLVLIKH